MEENLRKTLGELFIYMLKDGCRELNIQYGVREEELLAATIEYAGSPLVPNPEMLLKGISEVIAPLYSKYFRDKSECYHWEEKCQRFLLME